MWDSCEEVTERKVSGGNIVASNIVLDIRSEVSGELLHSIK